MHGACSVSQLEGLGSGGSAEKWQCWATFAVGAGDSLLWSKHNLENIMRQLLHLCFNGNTTFMDS